MCVRVCVCVCVKYMYKHKAIYHINFKPGKLLWSGVPSRSEGGGIEYFDQVSAL